MALSDSHSHSHSTHLDADSEEDDEHFEKRQEEIYAASSYLIQLGFNRKLFTIKNIYKHGYTDNEFLELIKPLASLTYMDKHDLNHLAQSANRRYAKLTPYRFQNFIDFANWLNEADGKRTLEFLSNKNKNIVRKDLTTAEVSIARMFIEYGAFRKQQRDRIREKIDELLIQQKKLEMEYESIDDELKRKLGPLYEYKEPELPDLRIEAYKLYEEDCKSKGISAIPKHHVKGFKKAMRLFGDVAKERLQLVSYLNDPIRQQNVRNFVKGKIIRMEHVTKGGETTIVYKDATDMCEEISSGNIVYKHESEAREENSDGRKATTIIYKFEPDSKKAPKQKAKRQEQEHEGDAKKMKSITLG